MNIFDEVIQTYVNEIQKLKNILGEGGAENFSHYQNIVGDTLTLPNSTVANARVKLTCITDDGTNSIWKAETVSTPIATIA